MSRADLMERLRVLLTGVQGPVAMEYTRLPFQVGQKLHWDVRFYIVGTDVGYSCTMLANESADVRGIAGEADGDSDRYSLVRRGLLRRH